MSSYTAQTETAQVFKKGETRTFYADFGPMIDTLTIAASPAPTGTLEQGVTGTVSTPARVTTDTVVDGVTIEANTGLSFVVTGLVPNDNEEDTIVTLTCTLSNGDVVKLGYRIFVVDTPTQA